MFINVCWTAWSDVATATVVYMIWSLFLHISRLNLCAVGLTQVFDVSATYVIEDLSPQVTCSGILTGQAFTAVITSVDIQTNIDSLPEQASLQIAGCW